MQHTDAEKALLIEVQAHFPRWTCAISAAQPDGSGLIDYDEPPTVTATPPALTSLRTPGLYLTIERYDDREPRIKYHVTARTVSRGLIDRGVGADLATASRDLFNASVLTIHAASDVVRSLSEAAFDILDVVESIRKIKRDSPPGISRR